MAKGDAARGYVDPTPPPGGWNWEGTPVGGGMGGNIGPSLGMGMPGIMGRMGQEPGQQQQQNPLFQNMDPRLVQLFQKFNVNPTGTGTGNSDINYWNQKMGEKGADQQYYLNRLQSNFEGTGPDLGNNNLSYGGNQGQLAQRYYQQPMQRGWGQSNGRWGWGGSPRMNMGGQMSGGFGGGINKGAGVGPNYGGNYRNDPRSPWGNKPPAFNPTTTPTPTPNPDTSEHPK